MKEVLKVGLLGCGIAGHTVHLNAIESLPNRFRLSHCHDPVPDVMASVARRTGASAADPDVLVESVDVVCIAASVERRLESLATALAAAPRAVVLDVPLGLTQPQIGEVLTVIEQSNVPVVLHLPTASDPAWKLVREFLADVDPKESMIRFTSALGPAMYPALGATEDGALPMDSGLTMLIADAYWGRRTRVSRSLWQSAFALGSRDCPLAAFSLGNGAGDVTQAGAIGDGVNALVSYGPWQVEHTIIPTQTRHSEWSFEVFTDERALRLDLPHPSSIEPVRATWFEKDRAEYTSPLVDHPTRTFWLDVEGVAKGQIEPNRDLPAHVASGSDLVGDVLGSLGDRQTQKAERPRIAMLGAGMWSAIHMANALEHGDIIRVASRTRESAMRRASLVGAEAATYGEGVDLSGTDAAIVATAPAAHYRLAKAALDEGVPVLVEKPMTRTVRQARDLKQLVDATGTRFVYGENWAWDPLILKAVEAAREIDVKAVEVVARGGRPTWGTFLEREHGGGAFFDGGAHPLHLARVLLGRPVAEWVETEFEFAPGVDVDVRGVATIGFAGGATARVEMSWAHPDDRSIWAEAEGLRLDISPNKRLTVQGRDIIVPVDGGDGYSIEVDALFGSAPVEATVDDGLATMEILAGAYLSGRLRGRVSLPFDGDVDMTPIELLLGTDG